MPSMRRGRNTEFTEIQVRAEVFDITMTVVVDIGGKRMCGAFSHFMSGLSELNTARGDYIRFAGRPIGICRRPTGFSIVR
jgi:hypothetical protein